jgi:hypothetical protein
MIWILVGFFFFQFWGWTQGLAHARQALYHWDTPPVSILSFIAAFLPGSGFSPEFNHHISLDSTWKFFSSYWLFITLAILPVKEESCGCGGEKFTLSFTVSLRCLESCLPCHSHHRHHSVSRKMTFISYLLVAVSLGSFASTASGNDISLGWSFSAC